MSGKKDFENLYLLKHIFVSLASSDFSTSPFNSDSSSPNEMPPFLLKISVYINEM